MNKKIYSTPLIEQTECLGMSNLCDVSTGSTKPVDEGGQGGGKPGSGMDAPNRVMF